MVQSSSIQLSVTLKSYLIDLTYIPHAQKVLLYWLNLLYIPHTQKVLLYWLNLHTPRSESVTSLT